MNLKDMNAAQDKIEEAQRDLHSLQDAYAQSMCPFEVGQTIKKYILRRRREGKLDHVWIRIEKIRRDEEGIRSAGLAYGPNTNRFTDDLSYWMVSGRTVDAQGNIKVPPSSWSGYGLYRQSEFEEVSKYFLAKNHKGPGDTKND